MQYIVSHILERCRGRAVNLDELAYILRMDRDSARRWLKKHALVNQWQTLDKGETWKRKRPQRTLSPSRGTERRQRPTGVWSRAAGQGSEA